MFKNSVLLAFFMFFSINYAQVGVGTTSPNGALDVSSTTDGMLVPRVALSATNVATVITPTVSELVYNTFTSAVGPNQVTPGYYYWDGASWVRLATVATSSSDWSLTGNTGTNSATNYLGTSDANDLVLRTNAIDRIHIDVNGNVGIGQPAPDAKSDIVQTAAIDAIELNHSGTAGNSIEINATNATNTSSVIYMPNFTAGAGMNIEMLNAGSTASGMRLGHAGTGDGLTLLHDGDAYGYFGYMSSATNINPGISLYTEARGNGEEVIMLNTMGTGYGLDVFQDGLGDGIRVIQNNSGDGVFNAIAAGNGVYNLVTNGTGVVNDMAAGDGVYNGITNGFGVFNDITSGFGTYNLMSAADVGTVNDMSAAGGTGSWSYLVGQSGNGFQANYTNVGPGVPVPTTAAGDGFGFFADINTATATALGIVSGAAFAGSQYGIGHGVLMNHYGTQGRSGEFDINDATNTDEALYAQHAGEGSAMVGFSAPAAPSAGTVLDANVFAYLGGNNGQDHTGAYILSQPAAGFGIASYNFGGYMGTFSYGDTYGVFAQSGGGAEAVFALGDMTATGVKPFTIDHPSDPTNKNLKHFAIESNEVLNMYRGTINLDANGQATIELPDYFDQINKDFSYQLTAIGTPQQPYVLEEIANNQFKVAGKPNTKVSWMVLADRNDLYLQQNPEKALDVVDKPARMQGKYLMPELYGQPVNMAVFPVRKAVDKNALNPSSQVVVPKTIDRESIKKKTKTKSREEVSVQIDDKKNSIEIKKELILKTKKESADEN